MEVPSSASAAAPIVKPLRVTVKAWVTAASLALAAMRSSAAMVTLTGSDVIAPEAAPAEADVS